MVTAALVAFGLLVVGWIAAPDRSTTRTEPRALPDDAPKRLAA